MKDKIYFQKVTDKQQIEAFLKKIPNGRRSFRYYDSRPLSVFKNHFVTYLLYSDNVPIAYGHLEYEKGSNWLGIAVADEYSGKGLGKKMMDRLILFAKKEKIGKITLTVDEDNNNAISLYRKYGFYRDEMLTSEVIKLSLSV